MKKATWATREPEATKAIKVACSKFIPSIFLEFAGLAVTSYTRGLLRPGVVDSQRRLWTDRSWVRGFILRYKTPCIELIVAISPPISYPVFHTGFKDLLIFPETFAVSFFGCCPRPLVFLCFCMPRSTCMIDTLAPCNRWSVPMCISNITLGISKRQRECNFHGSELLSSRELGCLNKSTWFYFCYIIFATQSHRGSLIFARE